MTRFCALVAVGLGCTACSAGHDNPAAQPPAAQSAATCITSGGGYLRAQLRGAVVADLDWKNHDMQCDGGPRPEEKGMRVTFSGRLPGTARQLRFIFGIDPRDIAQGAAQAMPTNLTMIFEGEQDLYATRGSDQCAVESLERSPLEEAGASKYLVHARGYCLGPATNVAGDARLLVPTFEFTGIADAELD